MLDDSLGWIGVTLDGRYRVSEKLGEGGMGHVYRAFDAHLNTDVVVKCPQPAMLADPEFARRFDREIRSLVNLSHPYIVKILDVGRHGGVPFAAMQFLAGGSLKDLCRREFDRLPTGERLARMDGWLNNVARALDFIHSRRYVHRDVKPDNILFDADLNAYLGDFGVVKALVAGTETSKRGPVTATGVVLGTPRYMAPEVIMGEAYDGRADQYSLAVTVYEVLCGRPPFDGRTPMAILMQTRDKAPPRPNKVNRDIPKPVSQALLKALSKSPQKRYGDCIEMAAAILDVEVPAGRPAPSDSHAELPTPPPVPGAATAIAPKTASLFSVVVDHKADCPACGYLLRVPASARGQRIRCRQCKTVCDVSDDLQRISARPAEEKPPGSDTSAVGGDTAISADQANSGPPAPPPVPQQVHKRSPFGTPRK